MKLSAEKQQGRLLEFFVGEMTRTYEKPFVGRCRCHAMPIEARKYVLININKWLRMIPLLNALIQVTTVTGRAGSIDRPPPWLPSGDAPGYRGETGGYVKYWPPLTVRVEPVMNPASSAARKTTQRATSSGSPSLPTGIRGRILALSTSSGTARTISVAI